MINIGLVGLISFNISLRLQMIHNEKKRKKGKRTKLYFLIRFNTFAFIHFVSFHFA